MFSVSFMNFFSIYEIPRDGKYLDFEIQGRGEFRAKGSVIFSAGYPLGAFLKGVGKFSEKIKGYETNVQNLRKLKIFSLLAVKGSEIFDKTIIRGVKFCTKSFA